MFRIRLVGLIAFVCMSNSQKSFAQEKQFGKDFNAEVVKAMTLEEYACFVAGTSKMKPFSPPAVPGKLTNSSQEVNHNSSKYFFDKK